MTDLTGQSIGRYQILAKIGEGGMATVYKARDTRLDRDVALKLIRLTAFPAEMHGHILARFEREAKSLARLSHNSIVTVFDYGEHDGAPYLALEYCTGGDLKNRLTGKPMDWREAVQLVLPVARALRYSHKQGVIHRDVKPSNVMFTAEGEPKLSDFGIAKLLETNETATLTGTGVGIGTPGYMAPEQWTGETSSASDQYGLGVVLYELLTGRKPYESDTPAGILIKQTSQPLPPPRQFVPGIPQSIETAVLKSLDRDPAGRYADMAAFIKAFEELLQQTPVVETPTAIGDPYKTLDVVPVAAVSAHTPRPADLETAATPLPDRKPINWKRIIIGGAGLLLMLAVFWGGWQLINGGLFVPEPSATPTKKATLTSTLPRTKTPTRTATATEAYTPTLTLTPTFTLTPTNTVPLGNNNIIAFTSNRNGGSFYDNIFLMNADGTGVTQLTFEGALESDWSPDGKRIVFNNWRNGYWGIYIINVDGSGETMIFNDGRYIMNPKWSPDGKKITFDNYYGDSAPDIFTINIDGSGLINLTNNTESDMSPDWSPNGKKIAFYSSGTNYYSYDIYVMNADGSGRTNLTNSSDQSIDPAWSPDGAKIVFSTGRYGDGDSVAVMKADGSGMRELVRMDYQIVTNPTWSSDGKKITFEAEWNNVGQRDIYVMNADGSDVTNITNNEAEDYGASWSPY